MYRFAVVFVGLVGCSSGVVDKVKPRASFTPLTSESERIDLEASKQEPTPYPLGTRFDVRAWWWGICDREAGGIVPNYSENTHERCNEVEHTATVACTNAPCEIVPNGEFDGFYRFEVEPKKVGPLSVVVTYKPKDGKPKTLTLGLTIVAAPPAEPPVQ
jgi:hypothetical protein